ncbi:hypothetical protein BD408DRAFT_120668 [Parasitella parasitica]|nr:hypothetical protein BD408DRAFT_120668 [Parasitella parasitica]
MLTPKLRNQILNQQMKSMKLKQLNLTKSLVKAKTPLCNTWSNGKIILQVIIPGSLLLQCRSMIKTPVNNAAKWRNFSSENAHQLVDKYWATHGGEEKREEVLKQLQGSNKAPAKEKKSATDEDKPEPKKKRANSRSATTTTSTHKRKRTRPSTPEVANDAQDVKLKETVYESEDEFDVSDSEIRDENFRINRSWVNVSKVQCVVSDEHNKELYAIIRWKDGELSKCKTTVLRKKAPSVLIEYYESRLSFEKDEL